MVYVLNKDGKPLMPTKRHGHVRRLLRDGRAVVAKLEPFTIRLKYKPTEYLQFVSVGIDTGSRHIGLSATTDKKELFSAEAGLKTDIASNLSERRQYRRTRRGRLRYRKVRFDNRVGSKKEGWLPPSVMSKIHFHEKLIGIVCGILPVRKIIAEIGNFDTQKLENQGISGKEYQEGPQLGYENTRAYVLARDGYTCQCCGGKSGDKALNIHHIESRKTGGDSPKNLITLCKTCHDKYHQGKLTKAQANKIESSKGKGFRDAASMNAMKEQLYRNLVDKYGDGMVFVTYGYITTYTRKECALEKGHAVDARVISGNALCEPCDRRYTIRQVRRHNRQIYKANMSKGGKLRRAQSVYKVFGFRLYDVVEYGGLKCVITGRRESGSFTIRDFDMKMVKGGVTYKKLRFVRENRRKIVTSSAVSPRRSEDSGVSTATDII